jgi:hypothetical protein
MHKAAESIFSFDRLARARRRCRLRRAPTECSVRALAVVVIDDDAQHHVKVARSADQQRRGHRRDDLAQQPPHCRSRRRASVRAKAALTLALDEGELPRATT